MTKFERFLITKGYEMYTFSCDKMKYQKVDQHIISTMTNLDHRYIHKDREGEICFGLHEKDKPTTLISPRPRIIIQTSNGVITEQSDDAMNIILNKISSEEILKAMYDASFCFNFNLQ